MSLEKIKDIHSDFKKALERLKEALNKETHFRLLKDFASETKRFIDQNANEEVK